MTDEDTVTIPKDAIEDLLERWRDDAAYAEEIGNIGEYDGIMGSHDELKHLVEEHDDD